MNLIELYKSLTPPAGENEMTFSAEKVTNLSHFRVSKDAKGKPALLISCKHTALNDTFEIIRLKHVNLRTNQPSTILSSEGSSNMDFTIIGLNSAEPYLVKQFFRLIDSFVLNHTTPPTTEEVVDTFYGLSKIFSALGKSPVKSIQGLWAELLIIDLCNETSKALKHWHNSTTGTFDFDSGNVKIEIKSTSKNNREHVFNHMQLIPESDTFIAICSLFVQKSEAGISIEQLIESISRKIESELQLVDKLNRIVVETLGECLEEGLRSTFDKDVAQSSIRFYDVNIIPKIPLDVIPPEVSDVVFTSDLTKCASIPLTWPSGQGSLFDQLSQNMR